MLALVATRNSNPSIAHALCVGEATVKTHLLRAVEKLGVNDRTRSVTRATEPGLLTRRECGVLLSNAQSLASLYQSVI